MLFIDANIFLEVELGDEESEHCKKFLESVRKNKITAITSDYIVYTCLIQLEKRSKSVGKMENFLMYLDNLTSLMIHSPTYKTLYSAFELMKKYKLDFDDALVAAIMIAVDINQLVSFDKHFDKVREIRRVEPRELLKS